LSEQETSNKMPGIYNFTPVDETLPDYKAGFEAGKDLFPFDGWKSALWQRGWADAEE
jgi:hypothetical protein